MDKRSVMLAAAVLAALPLFTRPAAVRACAIDNVASLSANGVPAMLATSAPTSGAPWAPFVLAQAVAPGAAVRLTEASADLARTLPAAERAAPFRWTFGDGVTAVGHTALHRYARPGRYHLLVYGYDRRVHRWLAFDSAMVRVVPAGQLLQANLAHEVLRIVITLAGFTWPIDGALILAVLILLLRLQHQLRARARHAARIAR